MNTKNSISFAFALLSASLVLGGCAGSSHNGIESMPSATATAKPGTTDLPVAASDLMFVEMMIPHHEQAVEMALMAPGHGANPEVMALAAKIASAQGPEIVQMQGMLSRWGVSEMSDHSGHQMDGMVDASGMGELDAASGAEFDRLFLKLMIDHHLGAISMAQDPLANGADPELNKLLRAIVEAQATEIEQMEKMLEQMQ